MATKTLTGFEAKSKTQREIKRNFLRLTVPGGDPQPWYQLTPRHSAHATDALNAWLANGVVEAVAGRYGQPEYRITAAGFDAEQRREAIIAFLAEKIEASAEAVAAYATGMARMGTEGTAFIASLPAMDPEAGSEVARTALVEHGRTFADIQSAWWSMSEALRELMMHRAAVEGELTRATAQGDDAAALYAAAQERAHGAPQTLVVACEDGDPLGGDA